MKHLYHFLKNYSVREKFYISLKEKLTLYFWKIKFKNFKLHFSRYLDIRKNGTSEFAFYHGLDDGLGFIDSIWYHIHFNDKNFIEFKKEFDFLYKHQSLLGQIFMDRDMKKIKLTYAYAKSSHLL